MISNYKKYYNKLPILSGFLSKIGEPSHILVLIFLVKTALKFRLYYRGVIFFPTKAGNKIPQKVLTQSFFEVFVLKVIFSREIKKMRDFWYDDTVKHAEEISLLRTFIS